MPPDAMPYIAIAQLPAILLRLHTEVQRLHLTRGWPYARIATACGVHRNTLERWVQHPSAARVATVLAIAQWVSQENGLVP